MTDRPRRTFESLDQNQRTSVVLKLATLSMRSEEWAAHSWSALAAFIIGRQAIRRTCPRPQRSRQPAPGLLRPFIQKTTKYEVSVAHIVAHYVSGGDRVVVEARDDRLMHTLSIPITRLDGIIATLSALRAALSIDQGGQERTQAQTR